MKCKNKCHVCVCPNLKVYQTGAGDSYNFFDVLAHNIPDCLPNCKPPKILKTWTTYRKDYVPKRLSSTKETKTKIPYSSILISDDKLTCQTTHKADFKPYSDVNKKNIKSQIIVHKNNISCPAVKFNGSSETKSSFRNPSSKTITNIIRPQVQSNVLKTVKENNQPFASVTTYSSSYKKPKTCQKLQSYAPKVIRIEVSKPAKYLSQYKDDFKMPEKMKRDCIQKIEKYRPPDQPMECKTTYSRDFISKKLPEKKMLKKRIDVSHCKKCSTCIYIQNSTSPYAAQNSFIIKSPTTFCGEISLCNKDCHCCEKENKTHLIKCQN